MIRSLRSCLLSPECRAGACSVPQKEFILLLRGMAQAPALHLKSAKIRLIRHTLRVAILLATLFAATTCLAHRVPECMTTIERNPNTGTIEIVHRLHAHDAEQALAAALRKPQLTLDTLEAQAQLALYVEKRFQIVDRASGKPIELKLIGAELDGDDILVFQESNTPLPRSLAMRNDVLRETLPNQVNTVNISLDSQMRTLVFAKEDRWKVLEREQ